MAGGRTVATLYNQVLLQFTAK